MLYSLVYVSTAADKLSKESLCGITDKAVARNGSLGITGLLLYCDGNFMQCLEGSKDAIDFVVKSIASDRRHLGLFVLWEDEIKTREFGACAMALCTPDTDSKGLTHVQEVSDWFNLLDAKSKSHSQILLDGFWQTNAVGNCR